MSGVQRKMTYTGTFRIYYIELRNHNSAVYNITVSKIIKEKKTGGYSITALMSVFE